MVLWSQHYQSINNNLMKNINMKVPALCELYQNQQNYNVHRRKLTKIQSQQKESLIRRVASTLQLSSIHRNVQSYQHRQNSKTLEIARSNMKIMLKLQRVTSQYALKSVPCIPYKQSKNENQKSRLVQQERENHRIRNKVKSMSSCLSTQNLLKQYRKSLQIKNRLIHYQVEQDNKVVLKIGKYFGNSKKNYKINEKLQMDESISPLPKINSTFENNSPESLVALPRHGKISAAIFYKKEDIFKNVVDCSSKRITFIKNHRLKTQPNLHIKQMRTNNDTCFPTEPQNQYK